jgi:hypothetical protein
MEHTNNTNLSDYNKFINVKAVKYQEIINEFLTETTKKKLCDAILSFENKKIIKLLKPLDNIASEITRFSKSFQEKTNIDNIKNYCVSIINRIYGASLEIEISWYNYQDKKDEIVNTSDIIERNNLIIKANEMLTDIHTKIDNLNNIGIPCNQDDYMPSITEEINYLHNLFV